MIRLFDTHKIRKQIELEGMWDFVPLGDSVAGGLPDAYSHSLPVPSCWEQHPEFSTYRGRAAYRKKVYLPEPASLRLEFKGASHTADVYFDGTPIGHHYNAYTPFSAVVAGADAGEHELVVIVDNRFSEQSALHIPNDYYTYGGLIRPVALEWIRDVYVERLEFTPFLESGVWQANISVVTANISDQPRMVSVQGTLAGVGLDFGELTIQPGQSATCTMAFAFPGVTAWNEHHPQLYYLDVAVYEQESERPVDDLIERVGFREVRTDGTRLLVNGESVFLKGFNRHEDYGIVGCAIPVQLMVKDLDLMAELGANAVRTSHYPNDERFLDLCDERGIYVWEENHARGLDLKRMQHPNFERQCEDCNREMVLNHRNHPSVIIWGILNECASHTDEGRIMYRKQYEQIGSLDASRPLTSATCMHFVDKCLELEQIVSLNVYSGWYDDHDTENRYLEILDWVQKNGGRNKPVILSEFGAAAIYGFREPTRVKWSEERQMDIIDRCLEVYMNRPEIVGTFIWQFSDCRVTEENGWFATRARTRNNKGVVDDFRRPKMACEAVKKRYRER